ncbi:sensor histidine kinase [Paenibacillus zeisoli]|uniref:Circadian input-output histidine kinase CikA n=1 Tax=Paenibacillus zeisoli TaxID=2496267 RepID=A0A3S1D9M6_9BACL|nr:ATP-binding protein [Paenibacillus zeisoli]RUT31636.1 sensor histidine kinase [Paenibacillus zeisoli]
MGFRDMFLMNLGMLISVAYLANVLYKYLFNFTSGKVKYISSVILMILSGWICMKFGFRLRDNVIFDLRFVPLLISAYVYSQPLTILIVGVGIGLARLTFGINEAAMAGLYNLTLLGIVCAGLNIWLRRSQLRLLMKSCITILVVNIINTINIGILGVFPFKQYMLDIAPVVFPLGVLLSALFALILRDFQLEKNLNMELKYTNDLLKKQKEELQKTKIKLEERANQLLLASQYKSEFLANMSHELRTPLNSILNLAQIIEESGPKSADDDNPVYGSIIYRSGQDLLQLINDILDLSKIEAGRMEISREEIILGELAEVVEMQFRHLAERKELEFEVRQDEGLPDTIVSDSMRLQQVLRNLLANAFKFTEDGKVKLEIRREKPEDHIPGEWIVFAVTDTGIGIAEDKHALIFEAFQQSDSSISRTYGGTGLGLSISRDLAELLGGFIRLQSKKGLGSTFLFFVPLYNHTEKEGISQ